MSLVTMLANGEVDDLHDELDILYFEYSKNPYVSEAKLVILDRLINMFWGTKYPEMDGIFLIELDTYNRKLLQGWL